MNSSLGEQVSEQPLVSLCLPWLVARQDSIRARFGFVRARVGFVRARVGFVRAPLSVLLAGKGRRLIKEEGCV